MLNILLKLVLAVLILSLFLSPDSLLSQVSTIVLIILVCKFIAMEKRMDDLQQKINSLLGKQPASTTSPFAKMIQPRSELSMPDDINTASRDAPINSDATPPVQRQQDAVENWLQKLIFSGNVMAKIGVLILFIGMAFFIKYVAEHNLLSIEIRHVIVALTGMLMVFLGMRLSATRKNYASILSGGGVGLMYMTVYSAFQIYHLLMPVPAFSLLIAIVALSGVLAIMQDAKLLALFGILGGFLAPLLISNGSNNYIFLFSYYLVLNTAVLGMAFFKSWWELNLAGFIFTFIITALWGWESYQPEYFSTTEPFLITFFLFYVLITILYALRHTENQRGMINTSLALANPVIVFGMQAGLVQDYHYGAAWSAFALCLFYGLLASTLFLSGAKTLRQLAAVFCGLAILFGTLTIPFTFTHLWSSTSWALESIILLWCGIRQGNANLRLSSCIVMLASMIMFMLYIDELLKIRRVLNEFYLSGLFIIAALLVNSYFLYKNSLPDDIGKSFARLFILVGVPSWYLLNLGQINLYVGYEHQYIDVIIFVATSCLTFCVAGAYLNWRWLYYPAIALLPAMIILSLPDNNWLYYHPASIHYAWCYSFAALYTILYLHDEVPKSYLHTMHLVSFLFLTWFMTNRIDLAIMHETSLRDYWRVINFGLTPALMLFIAVCGKAFLPWPIAKYSSSYQQTGGMMIACFLTFWFIMTCAYAGDLAAFPYLPLFNPLDITIALALTAMTLWLRDTHPSTQRTLSLVSIFCFIWFNAILLRTAHHWLAIPYQWNDLWNSMIVQAALSIFWSVIALLVTTIAARLNSRELWFCGFTLMWVVIIKLFLVDLSDTNTIERIITFIGVGVLMLINGYLSPLPPREK